MGNRDLPDTCAHALGSEALGLGHIYIYQANPSYPCNTCKTTNRARLFANEFSNEQSLYICLQQQHEMPSLYLCIVSVETHLLILLIIWLHFIGRV